MSNNLSGSFVPNSPSQREFLQYIKDGSPITLFIGGRQSGKTLTGCAAIGLAIIILGYNTRGKWWVISPSLDQTKQAKISFESLFGWRVNGGLIKRFLMHENCYILDLGFKDYRVEFKTADNPNLLRGGVVDGILADEAAFLKPEVWEIVQPCVLASGGPIFCTTTPNGRNFIYDLYIKAKNGDPRIKAVHAKTSDNPVIGPKILAGMISGYSDEKRRQEFEAEFIHSQGLVYTAFKDEHIQETPKKLDGIGIAGIDPGAGDPFAYLTLIRTGTEYYVVDEYFSSEPKTLSTHAQNIHRGKWEDKIKRRWVDPARAQDRIDLSMTYGLECWKAKNDLEAGINDVKEKFERGLIHIDPKCVNLIRELRNYCYDKDGHPIDKDNHCLDALRYVIFNERHMAEEVDVQIHPHVAFPDAGAYNEIYMPDGTVVPGFGETNSTPGSRR